MIPKKRPTLPGEFIKEDILNEFDMTQAQLADELGVSRRTINELVKGKRRITADVALRIGKFTKTNPEVWMHLQNIVDLWDATHSETNSTILKQIQPCVV